MLVANPIYDTVFKYLMEDKKIARFIISKIINQEIVDIDFGNTELSSDIKNLSSKKQKIKTLADTGNLTVLRMDFSAKIKTPEGLKLVIIELQKAKFATDIMRFRNYLGSQFANSNNTQMQTYNKKQVRMGIPILSIYFLGHELDVIKSPAISIKRTYIDMITNKELKGKDPFVESLTIDSYIVQIPLLTDRRKTELEILLSIFDQEQQADEKHILNIDENQFPAEMRTIIRRLQQAYSEPEVRKQMSMEDTIIDELTEMSRQVEKAEEKAEKEKQEKEKALSKLNESAKLMKLAGLANNQIATATGLSIDVIEKL